MTGDAIDAYGLSLDLPDLELYGVANRTVYVFDNEGTVTYSWEADDPTNEPLYPERFDAAEAV